MKCDDLKSDLIGLVYGEIDAPSRERLEAHLGRCESCREERNELESTSRMLQEELGVPETAPGRLFSQPAFRGRISSGARSVPVWRRLAAAAAVILAVSLFGLSVANTRVSHGPAGWSLQFSLLPGSTDTAPVPEEIARQVDQRVQALLAERLGEERATTLAAFDRRIEEERQKTLADLSRALSHQERVLSAGQQSDREELLRRDSAVERMVGSEIDRTHRMMGAVLAASRPAVLEQ